MKTKSCNNCKHIVRYPATQFCTKKNNKEIIYDESDKCDQFEMEIDNV